MSVSLLFKKAQVAVAVITVVTQVSFMGGGTVAVALAQEFAPEAVVAEEPAPVVEETVSTESTDTAAPAVEETAPVVTEPTTTNEAVEETPTEEAKPPVVEETVTPPTETEAPATETTSTETTPTETVTDPAPIVETPVEQSSGSVAPVGTPTLSTELPDYQPGETATILGKWFAGVQNVVLRVFGNSEVGNHYADSSYNVTADEAGSFTHLYQLDNMYRPFYTVTASTPDGVELARTTFTDAAGASITVYSQCANDDGDGYSGNPGTCNWVNGDLNGNNSTYQEEDSTVQRLAIDGLANGDHTLVIEYQTTKGGKHAYDFLTDDTASETWVTNADICSAPVTTTLPSCASLTPVLSGDIPHDPSNLSGTDDTNQNFKIRNGSFVSIGTPGLVSGTYAGDSLTQVSVTFNVNTATCADVTPASQNKPATCPVLITWGAHVSSQADWGQGSSAVNISGSPYHVKVVELDGASTGNRDNQMAASAIPNFIIIRKVTDPSSSQSFSFTTTGTGYSGFSLTNGTQNQQSISSGNYSVTESATAGWTVTNIQCSTVGSDTIATPNIANGSVAITIGQNGGNTVDCTFTNTLQQAHLTLVKEVTNDNGGTAVATDWTLSASGPTPISGTSGSGSVTNAAVNAGDYTLSESTGPANYTAGDWSCEGGTLNGSVVTLAAGASATCTIVNNDNAPQLHLRKTVTNDNGGTALATAWTLTATGTGQAPTNLSGSTPVDSGATFKADTYALAETNGPSGYTAGAWDCDGASMPDATHVTVPFGGNVTCTINNNDNAPSLTLNKVVVNDNGGTSQASAWTLTASGPTGFNGVGPSVSNGASFDAGTYTLSESGPTGYSASSWSCVGGEQNGADITVGLGQSATCTITNNDIGPKLTVTKIVQNDNGGTAVVADFPLFVGATGVTSGVQNNFNAGSYTVSETALAGYTGVISGDCAADGSVTLALGDEKSCTITNTDNAPSLTLIKQVVNNNGGNASSSEWTLAATGPTGFSGAGPSVSSNASFDAGTYNLSESGPTGYTAGEWSCSGGSQDGNEITLGLGQSATCTIINDDQPGTLIVRKVVINDDGGTKVAENFTFQVNGDGAVSFETDGQNNMTVNAGLYSIVEPAVAGYTTTYDNCSNLNIPNGGSATCTITNDDQPGTLIVKKVLIKDNGGNETVTDFSFRVNGGSSIVFEGDAQNDMTVDAGTYTVVENAFSGYTTTYDNCTDLNIPNGGTATCTITNNDIAPSITLIKVVVTNNGGTAQPDDFDLKVGNQDVLSGASTNVNANIPFTINETLVPGYQFVSLTGDVKCSDTIGDNITLTEGEHITCTITNDDLAPSLTLVKEVTNDNGGTAVAGDWTLTASGPTPISGAGGATSDADFDAGNYSLSESTGPDGYSAGDWNCVGGTQNGASVALGLGQSATCTIINNDLAPSLTLVKVVVNDNGGNADATDWTLTADGPTDISGAGGAVSGPSFDQGTYNLSETGVADYDASGWVCVGGDQNGASVTLGLGDSATCTITNDDIAPKLFVIKHVINDNGGNATSSDFLMGVTGTDVSDSSFPGEDGIGTMVTLDAGSYEVTETNIFGYADSYSADCEGSIGIGDIKTCTVTNDDIAPTLKLEKTVVNNNGGEATEAGFQAQINGNDVDWDSAETLNAGSYTASEIANVAGYAASAWGGNCAADGSVSLAVGENKVCTITNDDIAPQLTVIKHVINDNGGTADAGDFTMNVEATNPSDDSFPGVEDPGTTITVDAGQYDVTETGPSGYTANFALCSGTIDIGQTATCTITNNDQPGTLIIHKVVINDNGGTAEEDDFSFSVDGGAATAFEADGQNEMTVDAGTYDVTEPAAAGYDTSYDNCTDVVVVNGGTATCTITNNDQPATLTIVKDADPNDLTDFSFSGTGGIGGFLLDDDAGVVGAGLNGDTDRPQSATFNDLNATSYTVTETLPNVFWLQKSISCVDNNNGGAAYPVTNVAGGITVALGLGGDVTCTFVNEKQSPTRTQGFWQTHTAYTSNILATKFPSSTMIIGDGATHQDPINTPGKLFGGFFSNIAKTTLNKQRLPIDKARMQLAQQLIAAKLNAAAFGASASILAQIAAADTAYAGNSASAILAAASQMDAYNNSGDTLIIGNAGKATPQQSRSIADLAFWNQP